MQEITSPRPTQLSIAKVCHNAIKAYCDSLEDVKQPTWDDLPQSEKEAMLACVNLYTEEPFASVEYFHEAWLELMISEGWTYGSIEDEQLKTHPYIVTYINLPKKQHVINSLVESIVKTMNKN